MSTAPLVRSRERWGIPKDEFGKSTDLARGRETDVANRCQTVLNLGTENAEVLAAKYNVSANDLKAVMTAIAKFAELQPKPRRSKATSAAATREL